MKFARNSLLQQSDLLRTRRVVETPQAAHLSVDGRQVLSFCSNDYLGLASDARIIEAASRAARDCGVGAGASALISGHASTHQKLEGRSRISSEPSAPCSSPLVTWPIWVSSRRWSGAATPYSPIGSTMPRSWTAHACRAPRSTPIRIWTSQLWSGSWTPHAAPRKLVVTDTVFSMDGDVAPLPQLLELCEKHRAWLLVDDAHGFGVLGAHGRGTPLHLGVRSPNLIHMGTLGKAAGVAGAFAAGHALAIGG